MTDITNTCCYSFPRCKAILIICALGIITFSCTPLKLSAAEKKPNIVLILVDDLGWADIGCYGADLHQTPNIDRLAGQGIRFTDAYASAAICSPTRAAIMTGKYPARLHMTIWYEGSQRPPNPNRKLITPRTIGNLPRAEVTLAESLRVAGYTNIHIGKWHLGDAAHYPETQGFDVNIGGTHWGAPSTFFYPYRAFWGKTDELRYVPHLEFGEVGEYLPDRLTEEAIKTIEAVQDKPFFLYLAYHTVHAPIEAKQKDVRRFEQLLKPEMHHQNPGYAAMVHSLDENVGRLLDKLDQLNLSDNTIVMFASDNGGYINKFKGKRVTNNSPLRSGKGSLYEGGIRTPLLIRWPGVIQAGRISTEPVASMDYYPTLLEAVDAAGDEKHRVEKLRAQMDGESFLPHLKNAEAHLKRDALYFHYPHYYATTSPVSAMRQGDWKLLEYFEDNHIELYNLRDDLGESKNLADERPEIAHRLRSRLRRWQNEVNAQLPTRNLNK